MLMVRAESDIEAPIERVHAILMDFARYGEWNPFVVGVSGDARLGGPITLDVRFRDGSRSRAREVIEVIEAPGDRSVLTYRYDGVLGRMGLLRAIRRQALTRLGETRTRYETEESFTGPFTRFLPHTQLQAGQDDTARALKARAEKEASR